MLRLDVRVYLVLVAALVAGVGCGGDDSRSGGGAGSGIDGDVSFATTVQPFILEACNCHQSAPLMAPFSLKAAEAYSNTVGVASMQLPSMPLVDPGNLNNSYLWHKVNGTQLEVGGSGEIMPFTIPLFPDELTIFERWIVAGALP